MESLYRKYRPQTFDDVVGQQHVVATLQRAVLEGRTSHAYLFCGPRGTGKTTMARLLAKALMCEQGAGHLPDGTCGQCKLIAAGEHPDVYELDAASRTGVDSVREEIINSVSYAPTQGRYKVYIIDEVHMLTTAAFNALLKTLEEPPSHVVFVLCTTDPQKIPATILSRVQRFDFRPIGNDDIHQHLVRVCTQEGFTYEDAALELVTTNARGGMRDALSTLEQLSVFGSGVIGLEAAQDLLGAVSGMALEHVVDAIAARDAAGLFVQVGELVDAGRDLLQFTRELAARMRDIYVVAVVGQHAAALNLSADVQKLHAEARAFGSPDRLSRILTLLGDVSREMSTAPNQRLVLEIAFTRMARPEADITLESLAERVAELEARLAGQGAAPVQWDGAEQLSAASVSARQGTQRATSPAQRPAASASEAQRMQTNAPTSEPQRQQPVASAQEAEPQYRQPAVPVSEPQYRQAAAPETGSYYQQSSAPASQRSQPAAHAPGQYFQQAAAPATDSQRQQPAASASAQQRSQWAAPASQPSHSQVAAPTADSQRPQPAQPAQTVRSSRASAQPSAAWGGYPSDPASAGQARNASPSGQTSTWQSQGQTQTQRAAQQTPRAATSTSARQQVQVPAQGSASQPNAASPRSSQGITDPGELQRSWRKVVSELMARIPSRGTLLANAVATSDNGSELVVSLPKGSSFALRMLERPDMKATVDRMVAEVFGPRNISYKEGTGTDLQIPSQRTRPSNQRPSASTAAQAQSAYPPASSQPAYASAPTQPAQTVSPVQQTQPAWPTRPAQPASAGSDYPMPWDAPAQTPAAQFDEPYYEQVPYEDLDAGGFVEEEEAPYDLPTPSSADSARQASVTVEPSSVPSALAGYNPKPAEPAPFAGSKSSDTGSSSASGHKTGSPSVTHDPASTTSPAAGQQSSTGSSKTSGSGSVREIPNDLPPELTAILENAFEVFGDDVKVSRD